MAVDSLQSRVEGQEVKSVDSPLGRLLTAGQLSTLDSRLLTVDYQYASHSVWMPPAHAAQRRRPLRRASLHADRANRVARSAGQEPGRQTRRDQGLRSGDDDAL